METDDLAINPVIYAELAPAYRGEAELERALRGWALQRRALPYEVAFLAGQAFVRFRREGGGLRSPLPESYIGAHAEIHQLRLLTRLLTRDTARYRTCFPRVHLISPP